MTAEVTDAQRAAWRCRRCGSKRSVGYGLWPNSGPVKAQCVPCGAVSDWPPVAEPDTRTEQGETGEGVGTGADEGAPGQDTGSAWVTRSADCPEAPAQAHPLAQPDAVSKPPDTASKREVSLWLGGVALAKHYDDSCDSLTIGAHADAFEAAAIAAGWTQPDAASTEQPEWKPRTGSVEDDLRSRLGCIAEATYWDRPYGTRLAAIRGMCDLTTNGMTAVGDDE